MMTASEFLNKMKSRGAYSAPPATQNAINLCNVQLQQMRAAMFPVPMIELYNMTGGMHMGTGYIFGPMEIPNGLRIPIPSIAAINSDMSSIDAAHGKTIVGRNDLFLFGFDTMGNFMMLDNLTLKTLRTYDDPYRALADCLIAGKI